MTAFLDIVGKNSSVIILNVRFYCEFMNFLKKVLINTSCWCIFTENKMRYLSAFCVKFINGDDDMKKQFCRRLIAVALVVVMVTSMFTLSMVHSGAKQLDEMPMVSAGNGALEDTSFLTQADYQKLSMNLGSAESMDRKPTYNPLLGSENYFAVGNNSLEYTGEVVYGWSNAQLVSVMMSAPYWNELYYGSEMNAAGEASFELSTSYGTSSEKTTTTNVGITISGEAEVSYAGNGVVFGGGIELSSNYISGTVAEKSSTVDMNLTCGADKDSAVVCVVPLAVYKYIINENGEKSEVYVQVPVGIVYSVTSLENYNSVARSVNDRLGAEKMLEVNMSDIYSDYVTGDPSSYFDSPDDMPASFEVLDGRLVASDNAEITGEVYSTGSYVSISTGQGSAAGTLVYSCDKSNGYTNGTGYSMGAEAYGGMKLGVDALGITVSGTIKVGAEAESSVMNSTSVMNTYGIKTSVTYAKLPDLSEVSDDVKATYGFSASQIVWYPTNVSESIPGCPVCVISSTVLPGERPLYLPDDLHVSAVRKDSVTLSWSNPKQGTTASGRIPEKYEVVEVVSNGNVSDTVVLATVDGNCESVTVDGLSENTQYSFALRAVSADSKSVVGPSVSITTSFDAMPVITKQPQDTFAYVGDTAVLSVEAQPYYENSELSYEWQKLYVDRYSTSFRTISSGDSNTLEIGTYDMDSMVYRCVVKETNGLNVVSTVSDCASIKYGYKVSNYDDLCYFASKINSGDEDYVYGGIIVTNDITVPQGKKWTAPIGSGCSFKGVFDGQGYTISGLNSDVGGLFGTVENATIKNVNLKNLNVYTYERNCGGLCEKASGNSLISNCSVDGSISVHTTAIDSEPAYVSVICAELNSGTIEKCINKAAVSADAYNVSGICSYNSGVIKNCANQGNIKCGEINIYYDERFGASISGVVVNNNGSVENCYNTGEVTENIGGNMRPNKAAIVTKGTAPVNSYYLNTQTGDSNATSKTIDQFKSGEVAYLLNNSVSNGTQAWYQNVDYNEPYDEYPHFDKTDHNTVYSYNGSYTNEEIIPLEKNEDGVFVIKDYRHLYEMAEKVNAGTKEYVNGSYIVANDITFPEGMYWTDPIGVNDTVYSTSSSTFGGVFDGQGFTISNLNIKNSDTIHHQYGLFGQLSGAQIKNVNLEDVTVDCTANYYGTIAGSINDDSLISNCTVSGSINVPEQYYAGGIVGRSYNSTIEKCINYADIDSSASYVGGICGSNNGTVNHCANFGEITANNVQRAGGIVGGDISNNIVTNCFNAGKVSGSAEFDIHSVVGYATTSRNNYYLDTTGSDERATAKTLEQFKSGEVTHLLNQSIAIPAWVWFQNIDNSKTPDDFPTLTQSRDSLVFKVDREDKTYSNIPNDYLIGDSDLDSRITVMDATIIQMHCAKLYELTDVALANADTTRDNTISVSDATKIQGYIAGIIKEL